MQKIKEYFNLHKNPNVPFLFVGLVFIGVGIALWDFTWIALSAVFIALSGTTYTRSDKK